MRLAFCSPLPPEPTGIADYAAEVLALLAPRHAIDAFHDQERVSGVPQGCGVSRASDLVPRHRARPYDLVIHQLGNGPAHAFVYPLLAQAPGLLVLHDLVLIIAGGHAARHRGRARLRGGPVERPLCARPPSEAREAYASEVAYAYPREARRLVAAHQGRWAMLPYAYPLFHLPVAVSRATAVHNLAMERAIEEEVAGAPASCRWRCRRAAPRSRAADAGGDPRAGSAAGADASWSGASAC